MSYWGHSGLLLIFSDSPTIKYYIYTLIYRETEMEIEIERE